MKKIIGLILTATTLLISSCQKDKSLGIEENNNEILSTKNLNQNLTPSGDKFKLSKEQIQKITDAQTKIFLAGLKDKNYSEKAGGCPSITNVYNFITNYSYVCGNSGAVTLTMQCNVYEYGSYNYDRTFSSFEYGLENPGTLLNENKTLFCPSDNPNEEAGECPRLISYTYNVTSYTYGNSDDIMIRTLTTCRPAHNNPPPPPIVQDQTISFWACGSPSACENTYTTNPPVVIINPAQGIPNSYIVKTPCSELLCYGPYVLCPNSISMDIRKIPSQIWIPSSGFGSGMAVGNYEYRNVVFHYDTNYQSPFTGNSLPSNPGTFSIN